MCKNSAREVKALCQSYKLEKKFLQIQAFLYEKKLKIGNFVGKITLDGSDINIPS